MGVMVAVVTWQMGVVVTCWMMGAVVTCRMIQVVAASGAAGVGAGRLGRSSPHNRSGRCNGEGRWWESLTSLLWSRSLHSLYSHPLCLPRQTPFQAKMLTMLV